MGGPSFIPQIESEPTKPDHVQNMMLKATAEIAKPAVMPQSQPETAGAAAEQALVALALKMAAHQAEMEELKAKVAEMEANENKLWAQASDSAQIKEDLEAQATSVLFGKFGGGSSFSKSEASPRIKERTFVCEELMHDEVSIHGRLKLFLALTPNAAFLSFHLAFTFFLTSHLVQVVEERRLTRPVPHRPFVVKRPVPVHASFIDAIQIF